MCVSIRICFGRGDDTVGNPHRAQISQFEPFELELLAIRDFRARFSLQQDLSGGAAGLTLLVSRRFSFEEGRVKCSKSN